MPVNQRLGTLSQQLQDLYEDFFPTLSGTRNNTSATVTALGSMAVTLSDILNTLNDIKSDTNLINEQLGQLRAFAEANATFSEQTATTLDLFNSNTSSNFQALLTFLDLMNTNAAANALLIKNAVCGDCGDTQPPINGDGFACTTDDITFFGASTGDRTVLTNYVISSSLTGQVGDLARVRCNSAEATISAAGFWDGAVGTSTFYPLDIGGAYVEFEITDTPGHFQVTVTSTEFAAANFTLCVKAQPS